MPLMYISNVWTELWLTDYLSFQCSIQVPYTFLQGHGVFTTRKFSKDDFLLHYSGDLVTEDEARRREKKYDKEICRRFMYYFLHGASEYW